MRRQGRTRVPTAQEASTSQAGNSGREPAMMIQAKCAGSSPKSCPPETSLNHSRFWPTQSGCDLEKATGKSDGLSPAPFGLSTPYPQSPPQPTPSGWTEKSLGQGRRKSLLHQSALFFQSYVGRTPGHLLLLVDHGSWKELVTPLLGFQAESLVGARQGLALFQG